MSQPKWKGIGQYVGSALKKVPKLMRKRMKVNKSKNIDAFLSWQKIQEHKVLPKSAPGKAITY